MTIGSISDGEAGSAVRAKLNAVIAAVNVANTITYTGDPTGMDISLAYARLYLGVETFTGLTATRTGSGLTGLTTLDFGAVEIFIGTLPSITGLTTLDMGSVTAWIGVWDSAYAALTSLDLSALVYFSGGTLTATFNVLTSLNLPAYRKGDVGFTAPLLTSINLPVYEDDNGAGVQFSAASLTSLSLPAIKYLTGGLFLYDTPLVTFSMGATLLSSVDFTLTGAALNQASVNGILVRLAALDGTGGTTLFQNKTVNLSGGSSASPSGAGLTAKTTLEGRGCTVTVN